MLTETDFFLARRPRRNRISPAIRDLVRETVLLPQHLIQPYFVREGHNLREEIRGLPEIYRWSPDLLVQEVENAARLGLKGVCLFPVIDKSLKDPQGSQAIDPDNLLNTTLRLLKKEVPEVALFVDVALDPYTSHGHDGLINERGEVINDESVRVLAQQALFAAQAGADFVCPSDMMDGRIGYIRKVLDSHNLINTGIMSYAAKYASSFYGPFREALQSAPAFGNKKSYQMDPANSREALIEAMLDVEEGADILLIKPALPYLDIVSKVREATQIPIAAYHVSGEYSMVMAAYANGWLDADAVFYESLLCIRRAGADFIATYAATRIANIL